MLDRSASFVVAAVAGAATLTAASAPSPLYPIYQQLWGFSSFTLTVVFAVYVFALLAALLTVGSLSDLVGRRPVASCALVLLALGMVLFAVAGGAGGLVAARVVQGFAVGAATGTTTAMIMDAAPSARSGSIVSSAVPSVGIAVGVVVAGALVEFAPLPRQLVFWVLGAVYLGLAALVWWTPERGTTGERRPAAVLRSLLPSAGLPRPARPTLVAVLPAMVATWALAGLYLSLGSSVLAQVFGVQSHFAVGLVLGVFFLAEVVGAVGSTALPATSRQWAGYGALTVGVVVTVVALLTTGSGLYVVGSVVAGLGFGVSFRVAVDDLGDAAPPAQRGEVFATMYIVSYLAFSIPALAAGLAVARFGLTTTAVTYGFGEVGLVVIATVVAVARTRGRSHPAGPERSPLPDGDRG